MRWQSSRAPQPRTSGEIEASTIGPDRDLGDEVAVADVEVEDPRAGVVKRFELLAEPREVGRVDRRLDLDVSLPTRPNSSRSQR